MASTPVILIGDFAGLSSPLLRLQARSGGAYVNGAGDALTADGTAPFRFTATVTAALSDLHYATVTDGGVAIASGWVHLEDTEDIYVVQRTESEAWVRSRNIAESGEAGDATEEKQDEILARLGDPGESESISSRLISLQGIFAGITSLAWWIRLALRVTASGADANAARSEINTGLESGQYDEQEHSQQALATGSLTVSGFTQGALNDLASTPIEVISSMVPGGGIQIFAGDDYVDGEIFFTEKTGEDWAAIGVGAAETEIFLHAYLQGTDPDDLNEGEYIIKEATYIDASDPMRIEVHLDNEDTDVVPGQYNWRLRVKDEDIGNPNDVKRTIIRWGQGSLVVRPSHTVTEPSE